MFPQRFIAFLLPMLLFANTANARESDVIDILEYGAGIYGSIFIHELGHVAAAKYYGAYDIDINIPREGASWLSGETSFVLPNDISDQGLRNIQVAGLISASLAGEVVLQTEDLHENEFSQSLFGTAQIANLRHVYTYYTKVVGENGYTGNDIDNYEMYGGNPHVFNALLVGYTLWSLKRASDEGIPLFGYEMKF